MTLVKPDKIQYTSLIETYINYETLQSTMTISGSVGSGATVNFSAVALPSRTDVIAAIYATNQNTGKKMDLNCGSIHNPFQFTGSGEQQSHAISYTSNTITVTLSVFNGTGGSIALISQIWDINFVLYEVPY